MLPDTHTEMVLGDPGTDSLSNDPERPWQVKLHKEFYDNCIRYPCTSTDAMSLADKGRVLGSRIFSLSVYLLGTVYESEVLYIYTRRSIAIAYIARNFIPSHRM